MKRILCLLLLVATVFSLAACEGYPYPGTNPHGSNSISDSGASTTFTPVTGAERAFFLLVCPEGGEGAAESLNDALEAEGLLPLFVKTPAEWDAMEEQTGAILLSEGNAPALEFDLARRVLTFTAPKAEWSKALSAAVPAWIREGLQVGETKTLGITPTALDRMREAMTKALSAVTVLTQNIRCASDPGGNSVAERLPRFLELMEEYSPDLLGTQETTHEWNTLLRESLGEEYGMIGKSRGGYEIGDDTGGKWDEWNTVLYKKSRFRPVESGTFWLSETPDVPSKVETSTLNRIATWAVFEDLRTGEEILYVNTHFEHTSEEARTDEAYLLQAYLAEWIEEYPVYLTGDFNTSTDSITYVAMTDLLGDAMADTAENGSEVDYTYHGYGKTEAYIDFIFYADGTRTPAYARILSETYDGYVSDHFGVYAVFETK